MKTYHGAIIGAAIVAVLLTVLIAVNRIEHHKKTSSTGKGDDNNEIPSSSGAGRDNGGDMPLREELGKSDGAILIKRTISPAATEMRLTEGDNLQSFSVSEYSISKDGKVLWSVNQERIGCVQESPDKTMVLFFNYSKNRYQLFKQEVGKLRELDLELPHQDQSTRVNGWFWVGSDILIGENSVPLEPVPHGFEDEGWAKGTRFYTYDLKTRIHREVLISVKPELQQGGNQIIKDEFFPEYSYKLPIIRYYSIKGITDNGEIFLMSLDTSQPRGGNPIEEGWFILENG